MSIPVLDINQKIQITTPQKNEAKKNPVKTSPEKTSPEKTSPEKTLNIDKDISSDNTKEAASTEPDSRQKKRQLFGINAAGSLVVSSALAYLSGNDPSGQRFGIQDIVTNMGIMEGMVRNPNDTVNQLYETIKETTLFTAPTGLFLPPIASYFGQDFGVGTFAAAAAPLISSEASGYILNKAADPVEILTEEELDKQKDEVRKTRYAVGIAALLKTGLLINNYRSTPGAGKNNHVSNAMYLATLLNTLNSGRTTEFAHNRGEKVRASKTSSPVFFDGVISGGCVQIAEMLNNKYNNGNNSIPTIVGQSLISGIIATGGIYAVKSSLDKALNWALGIQPTEELQTEQEATEPQTV
jgi:hypothetical protein